VVSRIAPAKSHLAIGKGHQAMVGDGHTVSVAAQIVQHIFGATEGVAYDRDGKLLNSIRKKSEIVLDQRAYTDVMRVGLQMDREIDVPEGQVLLRTGIYDLNSGKAGTLGAWTGAQK